MLTPNIRRSEPSKLSGMLQFDERERPWQPGELGAVLRHQLASPFEFDLAGMGEVEAVRVRTLSDSQGLLLKSLGDLLEHPHPPIELLSMLKDFAKGHLLHPNSALPKEIAKVLYYAAILTAWARCSQWITKLTPSTIKLNTEEMLQQTWLDHSTRSLFTNGLNHLVTPEASQ